MDREAAEVEAKRLNVKEGMKRTTDGGFWLAEDVAPGEWEPVRQKEKRRWYDWILDLLPFS